MIARLWRDERGASALEFALVAVPLLLMTLGAIELGRVLFIREELIYAADQAARKLHLDPALSDGQIDAALRTELRVADPDQLGVGIVRNSGSAVDNVTVTLNYDVHLIVNILPAGMIALDYQRRINLADQ